MIMISPVSYRPCNKNVIPFKANNPVMRDAVKVSRMLDENGYGKTEQAYYRFLNSEIKELKTAKNKKDYANIHEEIGDILFDTIMLADHYGINPTKALSDTNKKITARIKRAQKIAEKPLKEYPFEIRQKYWSEAKSQLRQEHYSNFQF